ncbi:hypothetical protein GE21DRAFT_1086541 [Neurospora crassa]|nr:hypothetical protein GE21DRAFT_1086541 [Neurospora crassa]
MGWDGSCAFRYTVWSSGFVNRTFHMRGKVGKENWVDFFWSTIIICICFFFFFFSSFSFLLGWKTCHFTFSAQQKQNPGEECKDLEVSRRNVTLYFGVQKTCVFHSLICHVSVLCLDKRCCRPLLVFFNRQAESLFSVWRDIEKRSSGKKRSGV